MAKTRLKLSQTQKTAVLCALLFLVLLIAGLLVNVIRRGELSAKTRALEAQIVQLEAEKQENEELLANLNSKEYADTYAREQLDLKKKGEQLYKGEETQT